MRNITLSIDDEVLEAGRAYAREHRVSFNTLVRRLIEQAVVPDKPGWLLDTFNLMDALDVASDGPWTRDELYRV